MTTDRYIHALEEVSGELRLLAGFVDIAGRDAPPEARRAIRHLAAQLSVLSAYAERTALGPAAPAAAGPPDAPHPMPGAAPQADRAGTNGDPDTDDDAAASSARVHHGPWSR